MCVPFILYRFTSLTTKVGSWIDVVYGVLFTTIALILISSDSSRVFGYLSLAIGLVYFMLYLAKMSKREK